MSNAAFLEIDRNIEQLRARFEAHPELHRQFYERLEVSWLYHDNALEGLVLTYHELKAAIDPLIISDGSLIPSYDEIRNHKEAIDLIRATAAQRKRSLINLEFVKKVNLILSNEPPPRNARAAAKLAIGQFRRDNPLHRLYYHEISPPEKIQVHIKKFSDWLGEAEQKKLHPVRRAAEAHHKLMAIYPWPKHSGKTARLLMNTILLSEGYVPAIIHAVERQRYYEVLRHPPSALMTLVMEGLSTTIESALRFFDEAVGPISGVKAAS